MFLSGDIVRFRDWDDMKAEFGIDYDGDICTTPYFVQKMKPLCGMEVEILACDGSKVYLTTRYEDKIYELIRDHFNYSVQMFDFATNSKELGRTFINQFFEV